MPTILLVDDNVRLLETLSLKLSFDGYKVIDTEDGLVALEYLRTAETLPDIIVSDLEMPGLDGFQLLAEIRNNPDWKHIPVIFLTAFHSEQDIDTAKRLGVDDFVQKPFNGDSLVIAIENKLQRASPARNYTKPETRSPRAELAKLIETQLNPLFDELALQDIGTSILDKLESVPDEFSQRSLDGIRTSIKYLDRLINQVVILQSQDKKALKPYIQRTLSDKLLVEILEDAAKNILTELDYLNPKLQFNIVPDLLPIAVSPKLLQFAVEEILRNAFSFTPHDGLITVEVFPRNGWITLLVNNEGSTIPPAHYKRIWERFEQLSVPATYLRGMGLGLSVVKAIVENHGGQVAVSSTPSPSTTVAIRFPLKPDTD